MTLITTAKKLRRWVGRLCTLSRKACQYPERRHQDIKYGIYKSFGPCFPIYLNQKRIEGSDRRAG